MTEVLLFSEGPTFKVLIVEDNPFFRKSLLEGLLKQYPPILVEEPRDGNEAIGKCILLSGKAYKLRSGYADRVNSF